MERKIGKIFEYNGKWYQCVKGTGCQGCDLETNCKSTVICIADGIQDREEVIFKKLEKVGEPYKFQKRTIQTYKLYIEPFISVDMDFIWAYVKSSNTIDIIIKQDKEDMEEKKLNLKPFDIQKAKEGKPVCTRDGRKARIICFDRVTNSTNEYTGHLIVLVTNPNGDEQSFYYTKKGNLAGKDEYDNHKWDLMMLPEKKEGWAVIRKGDIYETEELAGKEMLDSRTAIMIRKISWEE